MDLLVLWQRQVINPTSENVFHLILFEFVSSHRPLSMLLMLLATKTKDQADRETDLMDKDKNA